MNVSSITLGENEQRKNFFIRYANSFMSSVNNPEEAVEKAQKANPVAHKESTMEKLKGIETLTIFPKQVIDGKTIITA